MDVLAFLRQHEPILKERFKIASICIFGSYARGEERTESDVDVQFHFKQGKKPLNSTWMHLLSRRGIRKRLTG
ncbi:MAG: nucleotidyltransferase domain-containing protein [Methanospirillum sp.]|nr:nucleotidyltransferase domain-containing protein [Methanospirillum sp.]